MQLSAFTWYDLLGVLPGASKSSDQQRAYISKLSLLRPAVLPCWRWRTGRRRNHTFPGAWPSPT
jgi:hypothetical protein